MGGIVFDGIGTASIDLLRLIELVRKGMDGGGGG
jgi:hypothetical protein